MRHTATAIAGLIMAVLIQAYFFGAMRPLGVLPNVLLVMLTFFALIRPASQSLAIGLAGGLMLDLVSGVDFGLRMAFYSLYALVVVFTRQLGGRHDSLWTWAGLITAGTVAYNLAVLSSLVISRQSIDFSTVGQIVLTELALNLGLALILGRFWRWLYRTGPEAYSI